MADDLVMDFFDSDSNFELNLGPSEEDSGDDNLNIQNNENITHRGEDATDQNDDHEDSESVAEGEDDQEEGDDVNADSNISPNLFSSVATVLYDEGVLPSLDIESAKIENADDLAKVIQSEVQSLYKNTLVDKLGEDGYEYISKGVSLRDYNEYNDRTQILESITDDALIEDVELSKNVVYEDYISKGMSPEKATKLIQRSVELGNDIIAEDAREALASLKVINQRQIDSKAQSILTEQKNAEIARVAQEQKIKDSIYSDNIFKKGPEINKATQNKVYKLMNTVVGKSPEGTPENALMKTRREDPIEFDTKLYYMYELTKGFTDFSKFGKMGKNKAITDLERAMATNKNDHSGTPGFVQDKESYGGAFEGHILNL